MNERLPDWDSTIELLTDRLATLQSVAPVTRISELRRFLNGPTANARLLLVELIKLDLAAAAAAGLDRRLSDYLAEFSIELPHAAVPVDLVLEELQAQLESGAQPDLEKLHQAFPQHSELLRAWAGNWQQTIGLKASVAPRPPADLPIGETLQEFRILRCLGSGAFAKVYLALQENLQRLVALKVSQKRSEESQTLSQLDHPNIVRVFDERELTEPPIRLLYMQFVGGGTLASCLQRVEDLPLEQKQGRYVLESVKQQLEECGLEPAAQSEPDSPLAKLDWPATVAWVGSQLAEGLDYAHRRGVIHRDVKPANILFAADATPRLADFNVSFSGITGRAGAAAYFGGSLAYMSPEQLEVAIPAASQRKAEDLDGRSDLFSLGVVLWEMLYGERPWSNQGSPGSWAEALVAELTKRLDALPQRPSQSKLMKQATGQILDEQLRRCLAVDPAQRPASGRELSAALRLALNPKAARRFYPQWRGVMKWIAASPPWLIFLIGGLIPNLLAALFNFIYAAGQVVNRYPGLLEIFYQSAIWVNGSFFALGIAMALRMILLHSRELKRLESGKFQSAVEFSFPWQLGHRIARLNGWLWLMAGLIFPAILLFRYQSFGSLDALHFCASLAVCGGVAMVYPFFCMTLLDLMVYYPRVSRQLGSDGGIGCWGPQLRKKARGYLLVAAAIPLIALLLLGVTLEAPRYYLLATILATAIGFGASVLAVQQIDEFLYDLGQVNRPE
jgi:serine/threonine protein kinase